MLTAKFNRGKQFVEIFLGEDLESYGTFRAMWKNPREGRFGIVTFDSRYLTYDTIAHEVFHIVVEYIVANRSNITSRNEERYATLFDEIFRNIVLAITGKNPKIIL